MPNNILITPASASIAFSGSAANTIRLQVEASGSVAFYGNSGSLFGIVDNLSGSLMSVNDISGLPILEVFSDDRVVMGTFNRNTLVVTGSRVGIDKANPSTDLDVSGSVFITGSLRVTTGITGSLTGTASVATTASYASNADLLDGLNSTVFATTGSNTFVGNQTISGSLNVSSSLTINTNTLFADAINNRVGIGTTSPTATLTVSGSADVTGSLTVTGGITGSWGNKYTELIGNNVSSSFTVTHNLNNTFVMAQVIREASGSFVYPDITISGSNALTVAFSTVPSSSEYRVNVVGF